MLRFLALILAALPTPAQTEVVPDRLQRLQAYLEHNPLHETVFDRLVHEAVELGAVEQIEREYAARLERDGGDEAARIVLARLRSRARQPGDALELLSTLERDDAAFLYLRGQLQLASGDRETALEDLERAGSVCEDPLLAAKILTLAGQTWARAGRPDAATRAFLTLAELDPRSFSHRLDVAALLADNGIDAAALTELHRAVELAGGDGAREVRAWTAIGRLHERRGRVEAQQAYTRAARLLGPGNWQRDELFEHRLALHRGRSSLPALVDACRADVEQNPSDPDNRRYLALALAQADLAEEARRVALQGTQDFPGSLSLGRGYADLLVAGEFIDEAVLEYQRLAALHPREPGLHREAGTLLAALERMEAARIQWARELERDPLSVELHLDLARLHGQFGLNHAADELLRRASHIAPGDLRPIRARGKRWEQSGWSSRVIQLLEQAQRDAAQRGDPHVLEELAHEWLEREYPRRAIGALEEALRQGGDRRSLLTTLVSVLEENRHHARASEVLLELFELAVTAHDRAQLARRIANSYAHSRRLGRLVRQQRRILRKDPSSLRAALLLAHGLVLEGEQEQAHEILTELGAHEPHREDALIHLAWLAEQQKDFAGAASISRQLLEIAPHDRRRLLDGIARLHGLAGNETEATVVYEELLALSPTNRSVLSEQAQKLERQRPWWAVKLLQQSLDLDPGDDQIRFDLALLYIRLGVVDEAREQLLRVLRAEQRELRARARETCQTKFSRLSPPAIEVEILRERLEKAPERFELGILQALLARDLFDYRTAHSVIAELLQRFPREPALLEMKEELRGLTLEGLTTEWSTPLADGRQQLELVGLLLSEAAPDGRARARAILKQLRSPVLAANLCLANGAPDEAQRILRRATQERPEDAHLWMRLAIAHLADDRTSWAARAVDEAVLHSKAWHLLSFQSELRARRRYGPGIREAAQRLVRGLYESRVLAGIDFIGRDLHERRVAQVVEYHVENRLERDFLESAEQVLLAEPRDPPLLDAVLSRMQNRHAARARALLVAARAAPTPQGWSFETWSELLQRHSQRLARR